MRSSSCSAGTRATDESCGTAVANNINVDISRSDDAGAPQEPPMRTRNTCPTCASHYREDEMVQNLRVCTNCGYHFPVTARERIVQLVDEGTFSELAANLESTDPLEFVDSRPYPERLGRRGGQHRPARRDRRRLGRDRGHADRSGRDGLRVPGRLDGLGRRREVRPRRRPRARPAPASGLGGGIGRRAHAGGRARAHADGKDGRGDRRAAGGRPARSCRCWRTRPPAASPPASPPSAT